MNNNLKKLRKDAGFTLRSLGDECGLQFQHIHLLEQEDGCAEIAERVQNRQGAR